MILRSQMKELAKTIRDQDAKKKRLPVHKSPASTETFKTEEQTMKGMAGEAKRRAIKSLAEPAFYKKGGTVKKSGMAMVHKGEKVLTKKQATAKKPCKK